MKRILVLLALLMFQQGFAQVSPHPYRGTISTAGADCSTATNCVVVTIPPETASATIAVDADTGTWSGTVQFEGSVDGTTWIAMVPTSNSTSGSSSTTATGTWQFNPSSYTRLRARGSARVSGTAGILINWSNATASNGGTHLNPQGAANDLTCILGVNVLGPCDTGVATYSSSTLRVPAIVVGNGLPADSSVLVNKEVQWDSTNHRLTLCSTAPCDTAIKVGANTADGTGTGGCGGGGVAGSSPSCAWRAGGNGITVTLTAGTNTEGGMVTPNAAGTVDYAGAYAALSAGTVVTGQLINTPGAGGGTAIVILFPWFRVPPTLPSLVQTLMFGMGSVNITTTQQWMTAFGSTANAGRGSSIVAINGTVDHMDCRTNIVNAGQTFTFTMYHGASFADATATSMACTTASSGTTCSTTGNTFTIAPTDTLTILVVTSSGTATGYATCGVKITGIS